MVEQAVIAENAAAARPSRRLRWRNRLVRLTLPLAVLLLLIYTADQLLYGERGIVTWRLMQQQVQDLQAHNVQLNDDINRLNDQVRRLKPDAQGKLDEDFLDETIRRTLPAVKAGENVVMVSPSGSGSIVTGREWESSGQ